MRRLKRVISLAFFFALSVAFFSTTGAPLGTTSSTRKGDAPASEGATVTAGHARFTILTPRLIRAEYALNSEFDDRATFTIVNRALPVPYFNVSRSGETTTITTDALVLTFKDSPPPPPPAPSAVCAAAKHFSGSMLVGGYVLNNAAPVTGDCCAVCAATAGCTSWSKKLASGECLLYGGTFEVRASVGSDCGILPAPLPGSLFSSLEVALGSGGWKPGAINPQQLNGTYSELGCYVDAMTCVGSYWEQRMKLGLVARSGIVAIDDSTTPRLVDGAAVDAIVPQWHAPAAQGTNDIYIHGYENDYIGFMKDWAQLSGSISLPRRSALGVWYGRYWPVSEGDEDEILAEYAARSLPLAGAMLDMDWHIEPPKSSKCLSWGQYVWNNTLWPTPTNFTARVHAGDTPLGHAIDLSLNVHPQTGIDICEPSYPAFATSMGIDPSTNATVPCDMGNATFARSLYELILSREDLRGSDWWWTDYFGCASVSLAPSNPLQWTNLLWTQFNALRFPASRPMLLSRNGGLGTQRIPISFSGDTIQHEATLDFLIQTTPTASNALIPWWSHDVGGFDIRPINGPGDADPTNFTACLLLLRWYQASVTFPIFRQHCDHCERRIWLFPSVYEFLADTLRLRAALVPYIYSSAHAHASAGVPIVRPMYWTSPDSDDAYAHSRQYFFGDDIVAAPISTVYWSGNGGAADNTTEKDVWLPPGAWASWDGTMVYQGPAVVTAVSTFNSTPLFVRGGALLPLAGCDSSAVTSPAIAWVLFPGGSVGASVNASLWEDDGASPIAGGATTSALATPGVGGGVVLLLNAVQGSYPNIPDSRPHEFQSRSWPLGTLPTSVTIDGMLLAQRAPDAPATTPGWFVVPASAHSLLAPVGSLRVITAPLSMAEGHTLVVGGV